MDSLDRLSSLFDRFSLKVRRAAPAAASMVVLASRARGDYRVLFRPTGLGIDCGADIFVFGAEIDWGGADNPLIAALPALISFDPAADADGGALVGVLRAELQENRCGSGAAASRLCEVLLIRMLRARIGAGATGPGLVAGLGDHGEDDLSVKFDRRIGETGIDVEGHRRDVVFAGHIPRRDHRDDAGSRSNGRQIERRDRAARDRRAARRDVQEAGGLGQIIDIGG